jgi:hypothetical protein
VLDEQQASLRPQTLDLLLDLGRAAPDAQLRAADALDAKLVQVFAAGTVLIGLPAIRGAPHHAASATLFAIAVCAFLVLAFYSIRALWTRRFRVLIAPDQLWYRFWDEPPEAIKHAVVADLASAYTENNAQLLRKRRELGRALVAVGVEAAAIGVALVVASF